MEDFIGIIILLCIIGLIVGIINPKFVIRWGEEKDKNRKNVFKYYGVGSIISFILFGAIIDNNENIKQKNTTKPVVSSQNKEKGQDNKKVAKSFDDKVVALGDLNSLTLDKESDVVKLREQYDSFTQEQRNLITKLNSLVSAESKIATLKKEAEKVAYDTGITYNQLARTPDNFKDKKVKFSGKVIQVMEEKGETDLRIAVDNNYDTVLLVGYDPSITSTRVLENDYVEIKGVSKGLYTYESTLGGNITVPLVHVDKISIKN